MDLSNLQSTIDKSKSDKFKRIVIKKENDLC